ncbi:hypothetical protein O181_028250 [Austropuccinia psidii MF-1]|uniref:DNA replication complex GINS protein PSF3 n=1 Tax=Austropuccinia psidii MF-1 TaxID=1389203 RepID=A0A9Q3CSD3_9BASI|nr:hypothetical protein [Austropuccinia psidii MF-1]
MDDYYSLDILLAENQKIPCIFNIGVPGMGYIEGTNQRDIQPHTPLEIPFWLASVLIQSQEEQTQESQPESSSSNYLTIQIPKSFNNRIRNALSASAKNVNLKNLALHSGGAWYQCGKVLLEMIEDNHLKQVLHQTLTTRLTDIMDLASRPPLSEDHQVTNIEAEEFLLGLDAWEKEILVAGQETAKRMRAWEKSGRT